MVTARTAVLIGAIAACAATSRAQETRSAMFGTVRDASGGVLPGIVVLITNEDTHVSTEVVTNQRGYFEVPYHRQSGRVINWDTSLFYAPTRSCRRSASSRSSGIRRAGFNCRGA